MKLKIKTTHSNHDLEITFKAFLKLFKRRKKKQSKNDR